MGQKFSKISDFSDDSIDNDNDSYKNSKNHKKNSIISPVKNKEGETTYLFLAVVNLDESTNISANNIVKQINTNKSSASFFASMQIPAEVEIHMSSPACICIALPKYFKMKFLRTHDGNSSFEIIEDLKEEYILGFWQNVFVKTFNLIPSPSLDNNVYFLNDRYECNYIDDSDLTAHCIYLDTIHQNKNSNLWVGKAIFSYLSQIYCSDLKHTNQQEYDRLFKACKTNGKLDLYIYVIGNGIKNNSSFFSKLPRPLVVDILSRTMDIPSTFNERINVQLQKYWPNKK